ncbi:phytochelatin synthase family protein (plasmid) [Photobacterium damselae subsp. damselae]
MKFNIKNSVLSLTLLCSFISQASSMAWGEDEALERLLHSEYHRDFARLSNFHESQENKMFCGVATATTLLNALEIGSDSIPLDNSLISKEERKYLPVGGWEPVFHKWTQNTVLSSQVKTKKQILGQPLKGINHRDYGLQLRQFAGLLTIHGAKVDIHELKELRDIDIEKQNMIEALSSSNRYLAVNYSRRKVGQHGGGHISPVAAYDKDSDSFLVLDVNTVDHMWHWVDSNKLIKAMNTSDGKHYRGYVIVSK